MKNILITQGVYKNNKNILHTNLDLDWYNYSSKLKFNLIPLSYKIDFSFCKSNEEITSSTKSNNLDPLLNPE